ncbi:MAG: MerR family transcriptional regulator [Chloroflexi bacterium]|nr:MerR family transcriptional regulator [Chloroflexota bacterium]
MTLSLNSVYNLKVVLLETGIKPDVLRAWERRYGLPMPERTAGGHRIYSEHDIAIIKWLMLRQGEGLNISRAVEIWKENMASGNDLLTVVPQSVGGSGLPFRQVAFPTMPVLLTGIDELRIAWLSACLNFDESAAEQALNHAFALYPVELVCMAVLQRGVAEIGSLWHLNRASVQQEHFASALAMRRLDVLLMASPAPTRHENIIVGCPAHEWHSFTPLLMALFIRRRGYNVIYLGANVPASYFSETIEAVHASLVVLVAQQLSTAASLQYSAALISEHGSQVAFGGRIFGLHPDLINRIAGHYLGNQLDGAIDVIDDLLTAKLVSPNPVLPSGEYIIAVKAFIAQRAMIEASLDRRMSAKGSGGANYFLDVHKYMGDNIIAALDLGSMTYLDGELDWLKVLLDGQHLPGNLLVDYLEMYSEVLDQHLAGQVYPVSEWIKLQLAYRKKQA